MPNISDKLKEFFGDPTIPGQAVEEVLMNAKEMGYGGSGLPEVTAADNGDVLTVVDGAWAKAEPSGGELFIITATMAGAFDADLGGYPCSIDKTIDEIQTAIEAGANVRVNVGFVTDGNAVNVAQGLILQDWGFGEDYYVNFARGSVRGNVVDRGYNYTSYESSGFNIYNDDNDTMVCVFSGGIGAFASSAGRMMITARVSSTVTIPAGSYEKVACTAFYVDGRIPVDLTEFFGGVDEFEPSLISLGVNSPDDTFVFTYGAYWWKDKDGSEFDVIVHNTSESSMTIDSSADVAAFLINGMEAG